MWKKYQYDIQMKTPLGIRYGWISMEQHQHLIQGILSILHNQEEFRGTIDESGYCCVKGKLVTPVRTICYTADGYMNTQSLNLVMHGDRNEFRITGRPKRQQEADCEKIL